MLKQETPKLLLYAAQSVCDRLFLTPSKTLSADWLTLDNNEKTNLRTDAVVLLYMCTVERYSSLHIPKLTIKIGSEAKYIFLCG